MFDSEEKARAREQDPPPGGLQAARPMMPGMLAGAPEFTDLAVIKERTASRSTPRAPGSAKITKAYQDDQTPNRRSQAT